MDYYEVPAETAAGVPLYVAPDAEITALALALQRTLDENDGIVDIYFYDGAEGGETGTITPAQSDLPFTFDLSGDPQVQDTIIAFQGEGDLVFTSVPSGGTITADVMGAAGVTDCVVDETPVPRTTYPILPKSITIVYAYCLPAQ